VALAVSSTNLFAGTVVDGVYLSTINGANWSALNSGLPPSTGIRTFSVSGTNLFAGTYNGGVWLHPLSE